MTYDELHNQAYDLIHKVRDFRTVCMLLNACVLGTHSISSRAELLPPLDDISDVLFKLSLAAENSAEHFITNLPNRPEGITP